MVVATDPPTLSLMTWVASVAALVTSVEKLKEARAVADHVRPSKVARWYIFKPKIPIWVNF
jgi:hypothetical protein